ncbi:putative repeat protein (TIGR02543 family), partial [Pontibacter virosus]
MKKFTFLFALALFFSLGLSAQFTSVTNLENLTIDASIGTHHKAQSKIFYHDGKHWAALANSSGTHLWRLDGTSWTHVLMLTSRKGRADCKIVGNVVHVFVYQSNTSQLISAQYVPSSKTFEIWPTRSSIVNFSFNSEVRTATIDIDGTGRMWLAYVRNTEVHVQWSDGPYSEWSSPIILASDLRSDDAAAVVAMPGKIGVLWSNQNTDRWGFKTHTDGDPASSWSADEVPASQSALNVGYGMADDHMNMKVASDGTLYCAIKTGYNDDAYPLIGLLVRRPSGTWDDLYDVSRIGTTPIVVLNEAAGKLRVIYPSKTYGGDILYNESPLSNISIGPQMTLMKGEAFRDPTSSKQNFNPDGVILTTDANAGIAAGVLVSDDASSPDPSEEYTLSVNIVGSGTVTKSPEQSSYAAGSTVNLTATPASGYQFAGWSGDVTGTTNPLPVVMNGDVDLTATFTAATSQQQVTSFTLVNSHTEQDLQALEDGAVIVLSELSSTKLNIRANTSPSAVGSVKFELSGA